MIAPDLLIQNPSVPGNATRSVAKTLVPSLLDLTSLASLHPTKSSSLPLVNLCLNFLRILLSVLFYVCSIVFNPEILTPDIDIYPELERKILFLYLMPS